MFAISVTVCEIITCKLTNVLDWNLWPWKCRSITSKIWMQICRRIYLLNLHTFADVGVSRSTRLFPVTVRTYTVHVFDSTTPLIVTVKSSLKCSVFLLATDYFLFYIVWRYQIMKRPLRDKVARLTETSARLIVSYQVHIFNDWSCNILRSNVAGNCPSRGASGNSCAR